MIHTVETDGCYSSFQLEDTFENCKKCPNRIYISDSRVYGDKGLCILKCEEEQFPINLDCIGCKTCVDCGDLESFSWIPKELCEQCPNRKSIGESRFCTLKECPSNSFRTSEQNCRLCEDSRAEKTSEEECAKCPNRYFLDGFCMPKNCPENHFRNSDGDCIACDVHRVIKASEDECSKCNNRHMNDGVCVITCPENFYLDAPIDISQHVDSYTECIPCIKHSITNPEECLKCSNRKVYLDSIDKHTPHCGEKSCSPNFFLDNDGYCRDCQDETLPITKKEECIKCPDRTMYDGHCIKCNGNCFLSKIKRKWNSIKRMLDFTS